LPYSEEDERENKSWIFWRCWVGLVVLKRRWAEKEARMKKGAEPFFRMIGVCHIAWKKIEEERNHGEQRAQGERKKEN
jgi:hypothetical protein